MLNFKKEIMYLTITVIVMFGTLLAVWFIEQPAKENNPEIVVAEQVENDFVARAYLDSMSWNQITEKGFGSFLFHANFTPPIMERKTHIF